MPAFRANRNRYKGTSMSERLIVVSTDCHAGLPIADYKPYVEKKYHEMMDMAVPVTVDMMEKAESTFLIKASLFSLSNSTLIFSMS